MMLFKVATESLEFYVVAPDKVAAIQKVYEVIGTSSCMIMEVPYKVYVVQE